MLMSIRGTIMRYVLCAAGAAGLAGAAAAQSAQDFYKGRILTIEVGSTAGGSYDVTSRLLARHLIKYLPGASSIIIRNVPGAGSMTSVLSLDNSAPKDGTTIAAFNPGIFADSMAAGDAAPVKLSNYAWLGSVMKDFRTCYSWAESKIASWEELKKQTGTVFGATGVKANSYIGASMLKNLFDVNLRIIPAYPGNREMWLGMERGEVTAACSSWVGMPPDWLENRKINVLVRLIDGHPEGVPPSVPYIGDFAKTKEQKDVVDFLMAPAVLGRPFIVSKQVPADRLALLRQAFDKTMTDKAFIEDAKKQDVWVDPVNGIEAQNLVQQLYAFPAETVALAGKVVN